MPELLVVGYSQQMHRLECDANVNVEVVSSIGVASERCTSSSLIETERQKQGRAEGRCRVRCTESSKRGGGGTAERKGDRGK
jgi:hypothetical protein